MKRIGYLRLLIQLGFILATTFTSIYYDSLIPLMLITLIFGPYFCGWICPFGTLQEFCNSIANKLGITTIKPKKVRPLRYLLMLILIFFSTNKFMQYLIDMDPRSNFTQILRSHKIIGGTTIVIFVFIIISIFIDRPFCNVLCPLGARLGIIGILRPLTIHRTDKCINCKACDRICPMGIDISTSNKIKSPNCIMCLKCIEVCPVDKALFYGSKNNSLKGFLILFLIISIILLPIGYLYHHPNGLHNSSSNTLTDGHYEGTAKGFRGDITVEVIILDSKINNINIIKHRDDKGWFNRALPIIDEILDQQSLDSVDTVSGATYSSQGIKNAVQNALDKAAQHD